MVKEKSFVAVVYHGGHHSQSRPTAFVARGPPPAPQSTESKIAEHHRSPSHGASQLQHTTRALSSSQLSELHPSPPATGPPPPPPGTETAEGARAAAGDELGGGTEGGTAGLPSSLAVADFAAPVSFFLSTTAGDLKTAAAATSGFLVVE